MSLTSRREYLVKIKERYLKAPWNEKTVILDEYCEATGLNRKYVIACLSAKCDLRFKKKKLHKRRKNKYDNDVVYFLK